MPEDIKLEKAILVFCDVTGIKRSEYDEFFDDFVNMEEIPFLNKWRGRKFVEDWIEEYYDGNCPEK